MLAILPICHLQHCRESPFVTHNNFGGGFGKHISQQNSLVRFPCDCSASLTASVGAASDEDRVALQSLKFASLNSAGPWKFSALLLLPNIPAGACGACRLLQNVQPVHGMQERRVWG